PVLEHVHHPARKVFRRMQLPDARSLLLDLPLDDGEHDGVLVLEIAVHQARAHLRGLRDIRHAGRVKAVLDEAFQRRAEDAFTLRLGTRAGFGRTVAEVGHGPFSCQPPPSTLYSVTRFDCSARRVVINSCSATYTVRCASS